MKAYCIFYGTKYSYNLVVDLQREFNKVIETDDPEENPSDILVVNVPVSVVLNVRFGVASFVVPIDEALLNTGTVVSTVKVELVTCGAALPAVSETSALK